MQHQGVYKLRGVCNTREFINFPHYRHSTVNSPVVRGTAGSCLKFEDFRGAFEKIEIHNLGVPLTKWFDIKTWSKFLRDCPF